MLNLDETKKLFVAELEELLDAEAPHEADSAGVYVESPGSFQGSNQDPVAGVPAAGVIALFGPVLLKWIAAVAFAVAVDLGKESGKRALKDAWGWFTGLFRKGEEIPAAHDRKETVAAITTALIAAGWDAGKAGAVAERVWMQGQRAGQQLASAA